MCLRDNPNLDAAAGALLAAAADRHADHEALVATDVRVTDRGFYSEARRFARSLLALGVRRGDKVAIWLPNRPAWLFAQYGAALIAAVAVALNPRYKAHELSSILGQSDSTTLILTDRLGPVDFFETLHAVLPSLRDDEHGAVACRCRGALQGPHRLVQGAARGAHRRRRAANAGSARRKAQKGRLREMYLAETARPT